MEAQSVFNNLLIDISTFLKKYGFKKQGTNFYKVHNGNWSLISFQKSIKNTSSEIFFAVNIGICSQAIIKFLAPEKLKKSPGIVNCHWQERLTTSVGNIMDMWWHITESTNLPSLKQEIESLLVAQALPLLEKLICDEQLLQVWESKFPDRLDFTRKLYLAALYKEFEKIEELQMLLSHIEKETEGKPTQSYFKVIKQRLQLREN